MTSNELLLADAHTLQKQIKILEKEIHDLLQVKQDAIADIQREPIKVLAQLDANIEKKRKELGVIDSEIEVKKEVLTHVEKQGTLSHISYSEIVRKHQDNASNALLRLKTANESLVKVKEEIFSNEKVLSSLKDQRYKGQEDISVVEKKLTKLKYQISSLEDEKIVLQNEIEEIRRYLERYRADKLNLENWEKLLKDKETYLIQWAQQLEKFHGISHS